MMEGIHRTLLELLSLSQTWKTQVHRIGGDSECILFSDGPLEPKANGDALGGSKKL